MRQRTVRSHYAPWLTEQIKRAINSRDCLKKKAVKTNSKAHHVALKETRNHVNKLVKKTKSNYFRGIIDKNKNNSKEMWRHLNRLIAKRSKTINIKYTLRKMIRSFQTKKI